MEKRTLDRDAERLFGNGASDDPSLAGLTHFVAGLRTVYVTAPDDATRAAHLRSMLETYLARASTNGHASTNGAGPTRRRRRFAVRGAVAGAGLVLLGGSAMAATGSLPDRVQDAVANVVRHVGVKIPTSEPTFEIERNADDEPERSVEIRVKDDQGPAKAQDVDEADSDDSDDSGISAEDTSRDRPRQRTNRSNNDDDKADSDDSSDGSGDLGDGSGTDDRGDPSGDSSGDVSDGDSGSDADSGRGDPIDGSSGDDGSSDAGAQDDSSSSDSGPTG
jgi:hypothetical protein